MNTLNKVLRIDSARASSTKRATKSSSSPLVKHKPSNDFQSAPVSTRINRTRARAQVFNPQSLPESFRDWLVGLLEDPHNLSRIREKFGQTFHDLPAFINQLEKAVTNVPLGLVKPDHRFQDELWKAWPFNTYSQGFMHLKQWWTHAFSSLPGEQVNKLTISRFEILQFIDSISPANFLPTNPILIDRTLKEGGANLIRGANYYLDDAYRALFRLPAKGFENFVVGRNVAITPGKVIFKDDLIELIQYNPTTTRVKAEPILIVPAWIMKYYILDLSPQNSLVKFLVDKGHTVFAISWKNPDSKDRYKGLEDYLNLGVFGALNQINETCPNQKIHAVGYCLGGTLLSIAAAKMGRDKDRRLASITLLAAQTDFSEPGNISMFIDQAKVGFIESLMRPNGYLDSTQMSSAFQMIGAADRKWAQLTKEYILGDRSPPNDLMAWNADGTRLSIRMHSQYLRHMYLNNDLAMGRYKVGGKPIHIGDINCPVFAVGTVEDFVAPWRSVYKIHNHIKVQIEFLLASGGHNAGIVSPPGLKNRRYQLLGKTTRARKLTPDEWLTAAKTIEGSWWDYWINWIDSHSSRSVKPPVFKASTASDETWVSAPGTYVFE